mmetsp:Transcript_4391/g.7338  ORF Transcript_4391/g.7338 Transcript_4391/m.7338 type:complete len:226 (-) Transcript_4391:790-1467(-)
MLEASFRQRFFKQNNELGSIFSFSSCLERLDRVIKQVIGTLQQHLVYTVRNMCGLKTLCDQLLADSHQHLVLLDEGYIAEIGWKQAAFLVRLQHFLQLDFVASTTTATTDAACHAQQRFQFDPQCCGDVYNVRSVGAAQRIEEILFALLHRTFLLHGALFLGAGGKVRGGVLAGKKVHRRNGWFVGRFGVVGVLRGDSGAGGNELASGRLCCLAAETLHTRQAGR